MPGGETELDRFLAWAKRDIRCDAPLAIQLEAYVRTFPGRMLKLLLELTTLALEKR